MDLVILALSAVVVVICAVGALLGISILLSERD